MLNGLVIIVDSLDFSLDKLVLRVQDIRILVAKRQPVRFQMSFLLLDLVDSVVRAHFVELFDGGSTSVDLLRLLPLMAVLDDVLQLHLLEFQLFGVVENVGLRRVVRLQRHLLLRFVGFRILLFRHSRIVVLLGKGDTLAVFNWDFQLKRVRVHL